MVTTTVRLPGWLFYVAFSFDVLAGTSTGGTVFCFTACAKQHCRRCVHGVFFLPLRGPVQCRACSCNVTAEFIHYLYMHGPAAFSVPVRR